MSTTQPLERFAFNQARFVFATSRTLERELMCKGISERTTLARIRSTPNGQKYLRNVSEREILREVDNPGAFMDANTDLGKWIADYGNQYVEGWRER